MSKQEARNTAAGMVRDALEQLTKWERVQDLRHFDNTKDEATRLLDLAEAALSYFEQHYDFPRGEAGRDEMPIMRQYRALKREAPRGSILLLAIGDFYEAFGEDAVRLSPIFGTTLTMRGEVPMTGCFRHALDVRMHSKFANGTVFAIAEVVEGRHSHGGLLRREIVHSVNGGEVEA